MTTNYLANEFINITESFNFKQHVSGATHVGGHTLDLVFSLGQDTDNICCEDLLMIRYYICIFFDPSVNRVPASLPRVMLISSEHIFVNFVNFNINKIILKLKYK